MRDGEPGHQRSRTETDQTVPRGEHVGHSKDLKDLKRKTGNCRDRGRRRDRSGGPGL